ncbi:hypothetical protein G6F46_001495 [Rhizopus delemar]|uniref:PX domain-containing protein n=2 Tax=Rhizopus TaxID=4842 RepID=A0A9P6ZBX7_9FUNG|nr:hypothetical protein G6F43_006310 [Rhizopus delemar]KAG1545184.1 hypothetical protein G6F51_005620 [Rhizopus arrhizus]KAG1460592.1 hypothetical protein G6F55_004069 [Rhizopus delemar]KAG1504756.1 hypothetical protein G6F54_000781 [Rhizopus delemar]KAG1517661.1 hypothetical protein G6F53_001194 [Rhizopus delemar]
MNLTVPEAAATPDTIQFKLVYTNNEEEAIVFRTFPQISWIHNRLTKAFPTIVLPPLPGKPLTSQIDDQDYVERKRLQVERFFKKLTARTEIVNQEDFEHFLSSDMTPTEIGPLDTGVLSFLRFNRRPNTERGFKSYKASELIKEEEQDTFHKHQIYILLQEAYFGSIAEYLNQLIQTRENLGDTLIHMGDVIIETTQSKYRLGPGLKPEARDLQRNLDKRMQIFGLLMDELGFVFTRQGKEENMKFGDVMIEYKNSFDPLKVVFNTRIVKLMEYAEQLKIRNKKRDKAGKLESKLASDHPELRQAMIEEDEKKAVQCLEQIKKEFDSTQEKVKQEIKLFERQKIRDLKKCINDYANLSIRYEKTQLQNLEKTLNDMQQPNIKPARQFMYQQQETPKEESVSRSSSIASSSKQKKRRQQKQHLHQNYSELQKPLQSSASLPTRNKNEITDNVSDCSDHSSNHSHKKAVQVPIAKDTESISKTSLSASYDDRLSKYPFHF